MEKKKLLLVAISVGVFLVIVIGASILVFSPSGASAAVKPKPIPAGIIEEFEDPARTETWSEDQPGVQLTPLDAMELVKKSVDIQGVQPAPQSGNQENVFYIYGETPSESVTVSRTNPGAAVGPGNRLIIDVPRPVTAAVPDAPRSAVKPATTAQVPVRQTSTTPKAQTSPANQTKSRGDNYWVQTGSFSTKTRAEGVKETLASKGISSLIENREVDGKTFFRVRVGPYTSKNEADYWLALIKSIHGFEESQVWKSPIR
jgi:DedD protein